LFLPAEGFKLAFEIGEQSPGLGSSETDFWAALNRSTAGVLENLAKFFSGVENLLRVNGHVAPCGRVIILIIGHYNRVIGHLSWEKFEQVITASKSCRRSGRRAGAAWGGSRVAGGMRSAGVDDRRAAYPRGLGFLRIVDRDLVELTNLQRQVLFDESDAAGEIPKSVAAANRLAEVNSQVRVESIVADVNAMNIESLCDVDLILDGTDNVATRYLINDAAVSRGIPWVYGGCVGVGGRAWGIWPGETACLRCVFPEPPKARNWRRATRRGVLGPAAGVVDHCSGDGDSVFG